MLDKMCYYNPQKNKRRIHIMKIFKKFTAILIVCLLFTTIVPTNIINTTLTVEAHSGRTDRFGGHHDYKNKSGLGSYHYHCGGNPPHLHENGICPYANTTETEVPYYDNGIFSSSTGNDNTSSSSSISSQSSTELVSKQNTTTTQDTKSAVTISDTSYDNVAFNATYYASHHSDVYDAYGDDAKALYNHFIKNGIKEGRQSSAQFCITVYKNNNEDLVETFGDDLIKYYNHYIEYGCKENRVSK